MTIESSGPDRLRPDPQAILDVHGKDILAGRCGEAVLRVINLLAIQYGNARLAYQAMALWTEFRGTLGLNECRERVDRYNAAEAAVKAPRDWRTGA